MAERESILRLKLAAQNDATPAFSQVAELATSMTRTFREMFEGIQQGFNAMTKATGESTRSMAQSFGEDQRAMTGFEEAVRTQTSAIERNFEELTTVAREMSDGLQSSMRSVERSAQQMAESTNNSSLTMRSSLSDAGVLIGLQQVGQSMEHVGNLGEHIFTEAIKQSAEFEASLSEIKTSLFILGQPMDQVNTLTDKLKDKALELGSHYHRSATEIAGAISSLVRNGVDANSVYDGVAKSTVQVSLLTKQNIEETAAVMSDLFNEYRDQFKESGRSIGENMDSVAKTITGVMYSSRTSMNQLLDTMKYVGNAAGQAGVPMEDLGVAIAILSRHAETGSRAGTGLNMMFKQLIAPSKKAEEALHDLGLMQKGHNLLIDESTGKLKPFIDVQGMLHDAFAKLTPVQQETYSQMLFGQQHFQKLLPLLHATKEEVQGMKEQFGKIDAERAAGIMMDNLAGDMMLLHANISTLAKSFGDTLHPAMRAIAQAIDSVVQSFMKLPDSVKHGIMLFLGIGSAVAIAGGALLGVLSTLGFLRMGLLGLGNLNPFKSLAKEATAAAVATKALAAAEAEVAVASEAGALAGAAGVFTRLGNGARSAGTAISALIFGPWRALGNAFKSLPGIVKGFSLEGVMTTLLSPFKNVPKLFDGIIGAFTKFHGFIVGIGTRIISAIRLAFSWEGILMIARGALTFLTGPWGVLILAISAGVGAIIANWDTIKAWVQEHFGGSIPMTWSGLRDKAVEIFGQLRDFFRGVWQNIVEIAQAAWNYMSPFIIGAVEKIAAFWNEVWPKMKELFVEVWNVMKVVLAPAVAMISTMIIAALGFIKGSWHDIWNAIKDAFKLVWDLIIDILRLAWDVVSGIFKVVLDLLTGHWGDAWTHMKELLGNVWEDIKKLFGNFVDNALNFGRDFVMAIAHGITGAIDAVVSAAQRVVDSIKSVFSKAPSTPAGATVGAGDGVTDIPLPGMATGGKVTKPTIALIGEGGEPEYVIPESKLKNGGFIGGLNVAQHQPLSDSLPFGGGGRNGGPQITGGIHITINGVKDADDAINRLTREIRNQMSFAL